MNLLKRLLVAVPCSAVGALVISACFAVTAYAKTPPEISYAPGCTATTVVMEDAEGEKSEGTGEGTGTGTGEGTGTGTGEGTGTGAGEGTGTGTSEAATGTGEAAAGTGEAATGTGEAATGTGEAATGTGEAATGTGEGIGNGMGLSAAPGVVGDSIQQAGKSNTDKAQEGPPATLASTPAPAKGAGERQENGKWYYYDENNKRVYGLVTLPDGRTCYYTETDGRVSGIQTLEDGKIYYFDPANNDASRIGWVTASTGITYIREEHTVPYGRTVLDDKWYYFDGKGYVQLNVVQLEDGHYAYYTLDGGLQFGRINTDGKWYYSSPLSGYLQFGIAQLEDGNYAYYTPDGGLQFGELNVGGKKYYASPYDGYLQLGITQQHDGNYAYYTLDGGLQYGRINADNKWYYSNPSTGILQFGVTQLEDGHYAYYTLDGGLQFGRINTDGKWYYSSPFSGYLQFGIAQLEDGSYAYYTRDGGLQFGDLNIGGKRYYASPYSGLLQFGITQRHDGNYAYYTPNGGLQYGRIDAGGKYYYADVNSGYLQFGLVRFADGNYSYYTLQDGCILGSVNANGKFYYANPSSGYLQFGWVNLPQGTAYYTLENGCLFGRQNLGGKWYNFDANGYATFGFVQLPEGTVYYDRNQGLLFGMQFINGQYYYFNPFTGVLQLLRGIDVSAHQGYIDWATVAASGQVNFVIARALTWDNIKGYYIIDPTFTYNVTSAKAHGLLVGAYLYSYAFNGAEMAEEITYFVNDPAIRALRSSGFVFDLPVFIDYEDKLIIENTYSSAQRTNTLRYGMQLLDNNGYTPGFYANHNWATNYFDALTLQNEGYPFWYARYYDNTPNKQPGAHGWFNTPALWQYCSTGTVPGITGRVDLNYAYEYFHSAGGSTGGGAVPGDYVATVYDLKSGSYVSDYMSNLLKRVVMAEIGTATSSAEAYKAQAVATHSWLLYNFAQGGTPSVNLSVSYTSAVSNAVNAVYNETLNYNGQPILAMYTSSNSGYTNSAASFWGRYDLPYLTNVSDAYGSVAQYMPRTNNVSESRMRTNIQNLLGSAPTGHISTWLSGAATDQYGYLTSINVCGTTVSAGAFYDNMYGMYGAAINSIHYEAASNSWVFSTYGNGHGLGISHTGLIALAQRGYNYQSLLSHYYPGTTLTRTT